MNEQVKWCFYDPDTKTAELATEKTGPPAVISLVESLNYCENNSHRKKSI